MLTINETLEVLQTYNIHSHKYEPTVYQNKNQIGICLDIKDSLFGYLTRAFTFNTKEELNDFLKGFFFNGHRKIHAGFRRILRLYAQEGNGHL